MNDSTRDQIEPIEVSREETQTAQPERPKLGSILAFLFAALAFACFSCGASAQADGASVSGTALEPVKTTRGPVTATLVLEPQTPSIGDIVSLTITVEAPDQVEVLMPEFGESLDRFAIVDFVPKQSISATGNNVFSQRYRLQTRRSGEQAIPPIIIEFVDRRPGQRPAPEGEDAYELLTERLLFSVESVLPADATGDLKPALGQLAARPEAGVSSGNWLLALVATAAVLLIGFWLWRRLRIIHQPSPYEIASARLAQLRERPLPERGAMRAMDDFFVDLSRLGPALFRRSVQRPCAGADDRGIPRCRIELARSRPLASTISERVFTNGRPGQVRRPSTRSRAHRRIARRGARIS